MNKRKGMMCLHWPHRKCIFDNPDTFSRQAAVAAVAVVGAAVAVGMGWLWIRLRFAIWRGILWISILWVPLWRGYGLGYGIAACSS